MARRRRRLGIRALRRLRRGVARPAEAQGRRRGRKPGLRLPGQVRAGYRAARGNDPDARPHGRGATGLAAVPDQVVLHRPVLPLRTNDEGSQARTLPAQPRHRGRGRRFRRGRSARRRHRRAAPHGRAGRGVPRPPLLPRAPFRTARQARHSGKIPRRRVHRPRQEGKTSARGNRSHPPRRGARRRGVPQGVRPHGDFLA